MKKWQLLVSLFFSLSAIILSNRSFADPTYPALYGQPVLDAADLLTPDQETVLDHQIRDIITKSHHQVMVLIVPGLQGYDIDTFGTYAGRHYGIGNQDSDDGVLMTIAPNDHKMRIDTGYGIEALLTDADTSVIQQDMKPYLKVSDWSGAIGLGIKEIGDKIVPLTPEQLAIKHREEVQQQARATAAWNSFTDFMTWLAMIVGTIAALVGGYLFTTKDKRRAKREEQERLVREKEERTRLARDRIREERRQEDLARAQRATKARLDKLNAMSPEDRQRFLDQEERERASVKAAQEERYRRNKTTRDSYTSSQSTSTIDYSSYDDYNRYNSSSTSSSSSSDSSSSDDSFSGGGGSFGGGGSSSDW